MVAARLTGCFSREDIRRVVSLRYGIDPARRQPAPLRQCPVRRAFSDPALPQGGPRAWPLSYLAGRKLRQRPQRMVPPRRHISLGFSTALFGTVGVLSGFMALQGWGSRTQSDTGKLSWRRGILLLAAGTGILAMLGTEGDKTDYAAHLFGLLSGFIVGGAAGWISRRTAPSPVINTLLGLSAAGLVVLCWRLAL